MIIQKLIKFTLKKISMKFFIYSIFILTTGFYSYSQNSDNNISTIKLESEINYRSELSSPNYFSLNSNKSLQFSYTSFRFNTKKLNTKLFSNFKIFKKNSYIDYSNYLRGCGPIENGFTKNIKSKDLMLSNIINNFINNYVFSGKGVFFRK